MPVDAYVRAYRQFGLREVARDAVIAVVNRFVKFRLLIIYLKNRARTDCLADVGMIVRVITDAELAALADRPGHDLPHEFVREVRANGDECFGAFLDDELCGYAWYATRPSKSVGDSIADFDSRYVYAYKNFTLPGQRDRDVQKLIKEFTFDYYRTRGKHGVIVAIDSLNFASRASTKGSGAVAVGYCAYLRFRNQLVSFRSPGAKKLGFELLPSRSTTTNSNIRIELLDDLTALLTTYRSAYLSLIERLPHGTELPYQPEWIDATVALYLAERNHPFFLCAWRESELIGIAPLLLERKRLAAAGVRRLHFWGGIRGTLNNMAGDFLIPHSADIEPCLRAFKAYLFGVARNRWDILDLAYFSTRSSSFEPFQRLFGPDKSSQESMQTFAIDLPDSMERYCNDLPNKTLSDIRRCRRKLRESGYAVEIRETTTLSDEVIAELAALHNTRQREHIALGHPRYSIFQQPREREALVQLLKAAAHSGKTRHYLLTIDGHIAAFFINFVTGETLHLFLTAFDSQYSSFGPSKILLLHICENEIRRYGTRHINLSTGEARYKREFSNRVTDNRHVAVTTMRPVGKLCVWIWRSLRTFRTWTQQCLI